MMLLCKEIVHAMWKPKKFKYLYLLATLYVFTLMLPSAIVVYWAFRDQLLNRSNAFSLLPKNGFCDAAVILMLIHLFITIGFGCTPLYFVYEKVIGMHGSTSICLRALARLPVVILIWFLAIVFPFFGPINSAVEAFTVYIMSVLELCRQGGPRKRRGPPPGIKGHGRFRAEESFYENPYPECICRSKRHVWHIIYSQIKRLTHLVGYAAGKM